MTDETQITILVMYDLVNMGLIFGFFVGWGVLCSIGSAYLVTLIFEQAVKKIKRATIFGKAKK